MRVSASRQHKYQCFLGMDQLVTNLDINLKTYLWDLVFQLLRQSNLPNMVNIASFCSFILRTGGDTLKSYIVAIQDV